MIPALAVVIAAYCCTRLVFLPITFLLRKSAAVTAGIDCALAIAVIALQVLDIFTAATRQSQIPRM